MPANSMAGSIATTSTTARTSEDTIVAIATPPGRGGIGIVRLSGPDAPHLLSPHLELRSSLLPGRARYCAIVDHGARLDEGVVTWFAAPNSYTGEDVVEVAAHGSPVILDLLVRRALEAGANEYVMKPFTCEGMREKLQLLGFGQAAV